VGGALDNPQIRGRLEANNLRFKGSAWRTLRTDVSASPSSVALENGELQAATQGHFAFNVRAGLTQWSYMPANPINVTLSSAHLSVPDLHKLAAKNYPIAGTLAINVSAHGSRLNPIGQGIITLTNGVIANEPIQNVSLNFHGDGNSVDTNVVARLPAGSANGDATIDPKSGKYNFKVHTAGLRLENLQAVKARNMDIAGAVNLDASGKGTMERPELDATLSIPELHVRKQTVSNTTVHT